MNVGTTAPGKRYRAANNYRGKVIRQKVGQFTFTKIIETLEKLEISETEIGRCLKAIAAIVERHNQKDHGEIPVGYWRSILGGSYFETLGLLKDAKLIEARKCLNNPKSEFYSKKQNKCKDYKICQHVLQSGIEYINTPEKPQQPTNCSEIERKAKKVIRNLSVQDFNLALQFIDDYIGQSLHLQKVKVGTQIKREAVEMHLDNGEVKWHNLKKAIRKAANQGMVIIQNNGRCKVMSWQRFKTKRAFNCKMAYRNALCRIVNATGRTKRNKTNNRLDTPITSFPSILLPHCHLFGEEIKELDLKNSQIVILCKLIDLLLDIFAMDNLVIKDNNLTSNFHAGRKMENIPSSISNKENNTQINNFLIEFLKERNQKYQPNLLMLHTFSEILAILRNSPSFFTLQKFGCFRRNLRIYPK